MKKFKFILAAVISLVLLASCGTDNTRNNSNAPSDTTNTSDTSLGNDVKNIGGAISDTAGDAVNKVENAAGELVGSNTDNNNKTNTSANK